MIGGDGTGPEVAAEGVKVLKAVAELEGIKFEIQGLRLRRRSLPARPARSCRPRRFDELAHVSTRSCWARSAIPTSPPGILEKGLLLELRFRFDQYINLRPVKLYPGVETPLAGKGPEDIDFVVVRENTEDLYGGVGGFLKKGTPDEVAMQTAIYTRKGCERCIRWAFEYTRKRNKKKRLTLVAKTNVLTYGHDLWWRTFQEVAKEYPDVKTDYNHVDACCMWMVKNPEYYDVIVTTNMFGDIITDLAGILQGGMGVAAGGNINPEPGGTSMFEPMGGSAPKYTGTGMINPIAAISAAAMLLEQAGHEKAADRVMQGHPDRHRHQDEEPGRRQDGLHHQPGRRPGVRGAVISSSRRSALALSHLTNQPVIVRVRADPKPRDFLFVEYADRAIVDADPNRKDRTC